MLLPFPASSRTPGHGQGTLLSLLLLCLREISLPKAKTIQWC